MSITTNTTETRPPHALDAKAAPPSYYAENGMVWKSPVHTQREDGSTSITVGFPVCEMHDAAEGQEGVVAEMLNRSDLVDDLLEALKALQPRLLADHGADGGLNKNSRDIAASIVRAAIAKAKT